MNTNPKVSIGIPTYNRPKGLSVTVQNFLDQTYSNIEIIISDNCSTDPEVQRVSEEFALKYSNVKYYRNDRNVGMYQNFNLAFDRSDGDFFMWASDDDQFYPEFVEKCLEPLIKNEKIVLCSAYAKVLDKNKQVTNVDNYDFTTVGLSLPRRFLKIIQYTNKSHTAFYGVYRSSALHTVKIKTMLDSDGMFLLEMACIGEFQMVREELMTCEIYYNENNTQSLTHEKNKLIDAYNLKPSYLLKNFEKPTMFLVFIKTFITKRIGLNDKIIILYYLFERYFKRVRLFSLFSTLHFFLRKKKLKIVKVCRREEEIDLNTDETILFPLRDFQNFESQKKISRSYGDNVICGNWYTRRDMYEQLINEYKYSEYSHILFYENESINKDNLEELIRSRSGFNKVLYLNSDNNLIVPLRKFLFMNGANSFNLSTRQILKVD